MSGLGGMRHAELLSTKVLHDKSKRFVCEILRMPDGNEIDWYFSDTPESVMVVPITEIGRSIHGIETAGALMLAAKHLGPGMR